LFPHRITVKESGLARPDPLDLGLDITDDLRIRDRHGDAAAPFFALGPVTKGIFREAAAVPDIRVQADGLARLLLGA